MRRCIPPNTRDAALSVREKRCYHTISLRLLHFFLLLFRAEEDDDRARMTAAAISRAAPRAADDARRLYHARRQVPMPGIIAFSGARQLRDKASAFAESQYAFASHLPPARKLPAPIFSAFTCYA